MNLKTLVLSVSVGLFLLMGNAWASKIMANDVGSEAFESTTEADQKVLYKKTSQGDLFLHCFYPDDWNVSDKRPAVVFFHGGGWGGGSPVQFMPYADYLASRGMVAFSAEYRVAKQHHTAPDICVMDGKSAIRWVRSHAVQFGIDPEKIAAGGGSAGGHIAAATATVTAFDDPADDLSVSAKPQALLLCNPVIDNGPGGYGYGRVKRYWQEFSPLHNIKRGMPPTLFLCGTKDKLIPVKTGELFKTKIEDVGSRCELVWYEGQEHGFFNTKFYEVAFDLDTFLVSLGYLSGPSTLVKSKGEGSLRNLDAKLIKAVNRNDITEVTELLDSGANVNAVNEAKSNSLVCAVVMKNLEMVKLLVSFGADMEQKNKQNKNALDVAHNRKLTEIETFLRSKQ